MTLGDASEDATSQARRGGRDRPRDKPWELLTMRTVLGMQSTSKKFDECLRFFGRGKRQPSFGPVFSMVNTQQSAESAAPRTPPAAVQKRQLGPFGSFAFLFGLASLAAFGSLSPRLRGGKTADELCSLHLVIRSHQSLISLREASLAPHLIARSDIPWVLHESKFSGPKSLTARPSSGRTAYELFSLQKCRIQRGEKPSSFRLGHRLSDGSVGKCTNYFSKDKDPLPTADHIVRLAKGPGSHQSLVDHCEGEPHCRLLLRAGPSGPKSPPLQD
ncbi:hypothetical protein BDK51DRAFT_34661 [Blyttiomyces helicus]|uniref:Uncharacterized protein n=1 Tax=Blyttiomyces helicus TaxID=388810 RepID=A0A4P9W0S0_9FUNG|nr:hypothetical protein BDK51DRAFT_34661 [Blyttiomyces helicus]|eukprot:RKO85739.1 hypothetical protein BDK51DRAFT_34661 [Blyttiomyces helicus]